MNKRSTVQSISSGYLEVVVRLWSCQILTLETFWLKGLTLEIVWNVYFILMVYDLLLVEGRIA
jgi:hypothetical protein